VWLAGEFNDWSTEDAPLAAQPDGSFAGVVALEPGRSYRFRYYLGDGRWDNDWAADDYVENDFGGADSVIDVPPAPHSGAEPRSVHVRGRLLPPDGPPPTEAGRHDAPSEAPSEG
jgi:1,4-alpha-glucan branching enzyme